MSDGPQSRSADLERDFRESRVALLISVNLDTFWSIAILLMASGLWDLFVDAAHWRSARLDPQRRRRSTAGTGSALPDWLSSC